MMLLRTPLQLQQIFGSLGGLNERPRGRLPWPSLKAVASSVAIGMVGFIYGTSRIQIATMRFKTRPRAGDIWSGIFRAL